MSCAQYKCTRAKNMRQGHLSGTAASAHLESVGPGGTDGATAIEVGGDIVKSAVGARASSNSENTAIKRLNPTLQRDSPKKNTFC